MVNPALTFAILSLIGLDPTNGEYARIITGTVQDRDLLRDVVDPRLALRAIATYWRTPGTFFSGSILDLLTIDAPAALRVAFADAWDGLAAEEAAAGGATPFSPDQRRAILEMVAAHFGLTPQGPEPVTSRSDGGGQ